MRDWYFSSFIPEIITAPCLLDFISAIVCLTILLILSEINISDLIFILFEPNKDLYISNKTSFCSFSLRGTLRSAFAPESVMFDSN